MKAQILKISGHKNEKDFYKEFPTMEAFMAKHGAAFKKAQNSAIMTGITTTHYPGAEQIKALANPFNTLIGGQQQQQAVAAQPVWQGTMEKPAAIPSVEYAQQNNISGAGEVERMLKESQNAGAKAVDTGKAIQTGIGMVDKVIGGFKALKAEKAALKSARTWRDVSKISRKASETEDVNARSDIADTAARTRKALMPTVNTEEFFPQYGVGTNVLARYGGYMQGGGEIQNTFAPGDIYDDGGYEPLGESDEEIVKAYRSGGLIPKAIFGNLMGALGGGGGGGMMGSIGNSATSLIGGAMGNNAGTQIGGGFGEAAGSMFGPIGGMVGKAVGTLAGGLLDQNPQKTARAQKDMMKNINAMTGMQNVKSMQNQYSGVFENGGYMSFAYPDPIEVNHFGEHSKRELADPDPMMNTLRTGGNIRQNSVGDIEAISGGHLQPMGFNPYSDGSGITSMIKGQSHAENNGRHSGVLLNYRKQDGGDMEPQVEAENNEPVTEIGEDAIIFGDIVINKATVGDDPHFKPFYGKTFKKAMAGVAEQNKKLNKQQEKNTKALNDLDPKTPIDKLKLNSLTMNEQAIDKKYQFNDMIMKKAAAHQEIVNNATERMGANSGEFSRNKLAPVDNVAQGGKKISKTTALAVPPQDQHKGPEGTYGGVTAEQYQALQKENPWFNWKGFDPNKKGDVEYFQRRFNDLSESVNSPARLKLDDLLGLQTASARIDYSGAKKDDNTSQTTTTIDDDEEGVYETSKYNKYGWENLAAQVMPWLRKTPGEPLLGDQLGGEMLALSQNQEEPVQARFLHPQLDVPYDISLQDRLNENQASFNAIRRQVGTNPEALAALAGQKYGADSSVLAEQFRANQAKKDQVYSQNRATLNQAQQANLQIADQQYVRQAQAKSATKAVKQEALNSIAAKIGQNRLENRTLQTYANMFPDFSYDKNYNIRKTGAPTTFNMPVVYNAAGDITHIALRDENNKIYDYRKITPEESKEMNKKKTAEKPSLATESTVAKEERHGGLVKAFKNL